MKTVLLILLSQLSLISLLAASANVRFNWFDYQGSDVVFAEQPVEGHFQNPVFAGFYPDPSICRVGEDYYLVHSSFSYFPGVPIFQSKDLVNWKQIGHVLDRPSQLDLDGHGISRGIFAPQIRYHDGVYYMITTLIDTLGNFYVTAENPAGPWSDPIPLPELNGIDPSFFFDDDGRTWIVHNGPPPNNESLYQGHRAVWLWEFDLENKKVLSGGRIIVNGGVDLSKQPVWIEAPHILKKDGWYYLTCAEGGTSVNHSQVIFRTRSLDEPFVPFTGAPMLTQRDLDPTRVNPITSAGHADLVETVEGDWWAVFLATRPYEGNHYNTGRETYLLPVTWEDGWPSMLMPGEEIPYQHPVPKTGSVIEGVENFTGNLTWRDEFDGDTLKFNWNELRTPRKDWYSVENGKLTMTASSNDLTGNQHLSYLGRRLQHMEFDASTSLELPDTQGISAGIVAFQNEKSHYYFGIQLTSEGYKLFLEKADKSLPFQINSVVLPEIENLDTIVLGVQGETDTISFYYQIGDSVIPFAGGLDGKMLSTQSAGGFVGVTLGMHTRIESE